MNIDSIINDRYEVISLLGEGGMGSVYKVKDLVENRICALKIIKDKIFSDKAITRFKNEFELAINLNHPNIVKVYSLEVFHKKDTYFFTMEYVEGENLKEAFKKLTEFEKYYILLQIARGLDYIHSRSIVHFDIKPDNIFVAKKNDILEVKIMDFGLASLLEEFTGKIRGTLSYIAPEVMVKKEVDYRVDLYSFGMVVYHLFSGKLPFDNFKSIKQITKAKLEESFLIEEEFINLDNFLKNLIADLCRARKEERIQSASQLIDHFETALEMNLKYDKRLESGSFKNYYHDYRGYLSDLQDEYLNFCLRGEKRSGMLTLVCGEMGCGKSELLKMFNLRAQLNRIPVLSFKINPETNQVNLFYRKLIFGLVSFLEKKIDTKDILNRAKSLIDEEGNFISDDDIFFKVKDILREIIENLALTHSVILIIDDLYQFEDDKLLRYLMHLVVTAPIFLLIGVEQDKIEENTLREYEEIFYLIPPNRIIINPLTDIELNSYLAHLLEIDETAIDRKLFTAVMQQTNGNFYLVKDYIEFLLRHKFLILQGKKYIFNFFSNTEYQGDFKKIYFDKINNLTKDQKLILLFIIEQFNLGETDENIGKILKMKHIAYDFEILSQSNLIVAKRKGEKVKDYYLNHQAHLEVLVKNSLEGTDINKFYDQLSDYYSLNNEKSIIKFAYCFLKSSAPKAQKEEVLKNAIAYARFNFREIDLKNLLVFHYENYSLDLAEQIKVLEELYLLLIWIEDYELSFKYFKILKKLLATDTESIQFATLLSNSAYYSKAKLSLKERLYNLEKAARIFLENNQENQYYQVIHKSIILLFRSGYIDKCQDYIQHEIKTRQLSEKTITKLRTLDWFFKNSEIMKKSEIYIKLITIYHYLEADFVYPEEDIDFIHLNIISQISSGLFESADNMVEIYANKISLKKNKLEEITLYFIHSHLLKQQGKLEQSYFYATEIEKIIQKRKSINGLLLALMDKLELMIALRKPIANVDLEFEKAISISKQLQNSDSLFRLYTLLIDYLTFKGEWRDVNINIKFALGIIDQIESNYLIANFLESATFYYYLSKDQEEFKQLLKKLLAHTKNLPKNPLDYNCIENFKRLFKVSFDKSNIELLKAYESLKSSKIKFLYLYKSFISDWTLNEDDDYQLILKKIIQLKPELRSKPVLYTYLEIMENLIKQDFEIASKQTVQLGKENYKLGYILDCYFPIASSLIFYKNINNYKKSFYFEEKLEKLNKKLAANLTFDKRDNFLNKYCFL